jgi:hypothetical protein
MIMTPALRKSNVATIIRPFASPEIVFGSEDKMEPPSLKLVFEVFIVVTLVALVLLKDLSETAWKRLEYVMLLFAATGLIPATVESRHWLQSDELHWRGDAVEMSAKWIQDYLESSRTSSCQAAEERSVDDKITATQREAICKWLEENEKDVVNESKSRSPIAVRHAQSLPASSAFSQDVKDRFDRYETRLSSLQSLEKRAKETGSLENFNSGLDAVSKSFGPYFLALALALKIAETHSDIRRKKRAGARD